MQVLTGIGFRQGGGGGGGGGSMTGAQIVAALAAPDLNVRALTARVWQDLGLASPEGPVDPSTAAVPYRVEVTTDNLVGVEWDASERLEATVEEVRAGTPGYVATVAVAEAARATGTPVVWDGVEVLDLATSAAVYASLTANSTVTLYLNPRAGADFLIVVAQTGAFTVAFAAAAGMQLLPLNPSTMAAATGAGAVTAYVGTFITATTALIAKVGSYTP